MKEDQQFYVGQKAFINKGGEVLILMDPQLGLDFPGGKIQVGENNHKRALKREVREETSLEIDIGDPFYTWYFQFGSEHRNANKLVYLVGFKCRYLNGEVKISDEHSEYRWVDKNNYKNLNDGSKYFEALKTYFGDG